MGGLGSFGPWAGRLRRGVSPLELPASHVSLFAIGLRMKRERQPTREEFEKLLAWFDPDPDKAAQTFNLIHSRLIKVFASRGCVDAEILADEVTNRVSVRIDSIMENYSDPFRCCLGFV